MSEKKRTKGKKKKIQQLEERKPQIKIGYGNPSELIAHQLIDKLISLTISQSFKNRVYSNEVFGTYCTRYCYEMVVPLVEVFAVRHDRDDLYDNEENWRTVPEVERVTFDRDTHTFVHVESTHNKSNEFNAIKEKGFVAFDRINGADMLIVLDEADKERMLSVLKHPFSGKMILLEDFLKL